MRVHAGQVSGRDHLLRAANRQDNVVVVEQKGYTIGIVCDGCGEGEHSEVGSALGADYLAAQAVNLLADGHPVELLPGLLYARAVAYLRGLVTLHQPAQPAAFVCDYLLFTVIGVIIDGDSGCVFAAGDGLVVIDETLVVRDEGNQPRYIGYHALPGCPTAQALPAAFDVYRLPQGWQRVAIASDGFEVDLLPDVWGIEHPRGLQRRLNLWSTRDHRFHDDAAIITLERGVRDAGEN